MTINIFPELHIVKSNHTITIRSYLRKKHDDGKYYLIPFMESYSSKHEADCIMSFTKHVYFFIILGIISPSKIFADGSVCFPLDDSQISEEERMQKLLCKNRL